jgi:hypothetical protein
LRQHGVTHQLSHAHMKVAQQLGAARHVLALDRLALQRLKEAAE